jgi:2-methylcitrate dehydratase PrpD
MALATVASTASATQAVARFALEHKFAGASGEIFHRARRAVIDTVGVTLAGGVEPCFTILDRTQRHIDGDATVLATGKKTTAAQAALLNGTAGHALDFDDVADELKGHPSVVLVSALLALAEARATTGRAFLEAYIVGFEIDCAIARALPVWPHYRNGWHATATVGILGATAAAGRMIGLDEPALRSALGIAASMAGGSRQNFGTMTKPLHAGLAARDAVIAVELAENGFTADPDQLEGPVGYFNQFGVDSDISKLYSSLDDANVLMTQGVSVKKYPCCYGTHRTADATLALRSRGVHADAVKSVRIAVEPGGLQATIHHRPTTGLQGKFSNEYVVAACLLDGHVKLASFTDAAVNRSAAQELLRRVDIHESAAPPFGPGTFEHAYSAVEISIADGSVVKERCDIPRGDGRMPLSDAEIEDKFRDCLAFGGGEWNVTDLLGHLQALEAAPRVMRW